MHVMVVFERKLGLHKFVEISALRNQSIVLAITCLRKWRKWLENINISPTTGVKWTNSFKKMAKWGNDIA